MATSGLSRKKQPSVNGDTVEDKKKPMDFDLFMGAVHGILRTAFPGFSTNPSTFDKMVKAAMGAFLLAVDMQDHMTYPTAVDAIVAFQQWIEESEWTYEPPTLFTVNGFTVSIVMAGNGGSLGVSLDCTVANTTSLSDAISAAKDTLREAVKGAFPTSADNGQRATSSATSSNRSGLEIEEYDCQTLRVTEKDGKFYYYAMPSEGRWQKYGIPLYGDVAKKYHVELPAESGEFEVNWFITAEMKENGKPSRVKEISEL